MRAAAGPAIEEQLEHFVVGEKSTKAKIQYDTQIFSWDMVLDSSHYRDHLRAELDRKVYSVDMESFGFLAAIEQFQEKPYNRTVSGIVIRGISDVCGDKATSYNDGRNALAMRNASVVASELVLRAY
jgi:nucleoside phosphorylase